MKHKSLRVSMIKDRHSDASLTCHFTNLIEEQKPDQSAFLKSSGSTALQIRFMDWQIEESGKTGLKFLLW